MKPIISIFGSSRPIEGDHEYEEAVAVGRQLAQAGFTICNGGYGGVMEASSRGAKQAGGTTIGITSAIFHRAANRWNDEVIQTPSLMNRLQLLVDKADGYVVLKGGTGTLLELAYVWEIINKRMINEKPIVLVGTFWSGVVETLRSELLWEGLGDCTKFIKQVDTPEACAAFLQERIGQGMA